MKKTGLVRNGLLIALLIPSNFFVSSCMHTAMLGHGEGHEQTTEPTLVKEVTGEDVRATATFPPLEVGKETEFVLKLSSSSTLRPHSRAQVFGHFDFIHRGERQKIDHMGMTQTQSDSLHTHRVETEHDVSFHMELEESKEPGVYVFSQTPTQTGEYTVGFHITAIGDRKLEPEIFIEVKRTVAAQSRGHSSGMMGMGQASTYLVVGGAVMGAMWIAMALAHGRVF